MSSQISWRSGTETLCFHKGSGLKSWGWFPVATLPFGQMLARGTDVSTSQTCKGTADKQKVVIGILSRCGHMTPPSWEYLLRLSLTSRLAGESSPAAFKSACSSNRNTDWVWNVDSIFLTMLVPLGTRPPLLAVRGSYAELRANVTAP